MDDYPAFSLDHNIPCITLFGLSPPSTPPPAFPSDLKEQGVLLRSEVSYVETKHGAALLEYIQGRDASKLPWNATPGARGYRFRVKTCGGTFMLPPRRARLPDHINASEPRGAFHSPFSPLSPSCRLYPDGFVDNRWLEKQQELLPSVFLCFYNLTSDLTLATLHDNQIKTDISSMRNTLLQQGYKSKIMVVILSDLRTASLDSTRDRLDNIRKGCALDSKSFLFMPSAYSTEEFKKQADSLLIAVYGHAVEHYRDLGRRARKKKGRGVVPQPTVPPTSGTSQTLSLPGWNVRYDFKSAVFAEFRQEMDQALRSFEQAYDTLTGADVLDIIPSWSPRWNEARQLADIISIRCLRCLLWAGQTSAAVRRWQAHRDRISDLIDRRGRGTENYGWAAWEARWAIVMAELIEKAQITDLSTASPNLFLQPEKASMGIRLQPWEFLHHPGYWYKAASQHLYARRAFALKMPEEDRERPGNSPAARVAHKAFTYDTYMCPEPHEEYPLPNAGNGVNHSQLIAQCLDAARVEFQRRGQTRLCAEVTLQLAKEFASSHKWQSAVDLLKPMWLDMSFRAEGWLDITQELAWLLRSAARPVQDAELLISVEWELLNKKYQERPKWEYDLSKILDGVSASEKPVVDIIDESSLPLLSSSFVFRSEEGNAGRTARGQLSITSNAQPSSAPIVLSGIQITFDGSIKTIHLKHDTAQAKKRQCGKATVSDVSLQEQSVEALRGDDPGKEKTTPAAVSVLLGSCDLTLPPGQTVVYEMDVPLREPGDAKALATTLSVANDIFSLDYEVPCKDTSVAGIWHAPVRPRKIPRANSHSIRILPRPPNVEIKVKNAMEQYYSNEAIELELEIVNAEDASAELRLNVIIAGEEPPDFRLAAGDEESAVAEPDTAGESKEMMIPLGAVAAADSTRVTVHISAVDFPASFDVTFVASYHLLTDPATPIIQTEDFKLTLVNPFEANYDLLPRLHPDPWPSVFDHEGVQGLFVDDSSYVQPRGLFQTWCLVTRYASFASEDLVVVSVDVSIAPTLGVQTRASGKQMLPDGGRTVKPKTIEEAQFDITAQKYSLDERDPVNLDVSFIINWRRADDQESRANKTTLPVPRLDIFGPEPRVLASVSYARAGGDRAQLGLAHLHITIENPSSHFLTFGTNMEPSDDFAFSGSKTATLHLLPCSRRVVTYSILPLVRGAWVRPSLTVRDKYFQKVLRVIPTEGMKLDKEGFLIWIPAPEEQAVEGEEGEDDEDEEDEEDGDDDDDDDEEEEE
ncbi:hypothetical protein RB598_002394 [Gaeumannomyces tritici]